MKLNCRSVNNKIYNIFIMSLKLVSLASGSKGNSTLILSDNTALLVDAGISYPRLCAELDSFGLTPSMLDGVVITHEHNDHIKTLPRLGGQCRLYVHPLTAHAIYMRQGALKNVADVDNYDGGFEVGDIKVLPFNISHDAAHPLAYSFVSGGARCSVATDIGVPTMRIVHNIENSEVVLLEANHDLYMLKNGSYPYHLKQRILSDKGHLSNDATGRIVTKLSGNSKIKHLILGHISENNNTEQCAYDTVKAVLDGLGDSDINLHVAHQHSRSEVFEIL